MAGLLGFTLADITGAVDSRKRQYGNLVRGLLSDPKALMEQLSAQDAEAAQRNRYTQASAGSVMPEVAQQGQQAMMDAALNVGGLLGITAYHGSPHKFDKFDMSKIGTGEGAQAYGHGLYFAENQGVADGYKRALGGHEFDVGGKKIYGGTSTKALDQQTRGQLIAAEALTDAINVQSSAPAQFAANRLRQYAKDFPEDAKHIDEAMNVIADWQQSGGHHRISGNLYKVDIPDEAVAKMLDWDKPLSQQPEAVRNALQKSWLAHPDVDGKLTGAQIYQRAGITLQGKEGTQAAAEQLRAAGIPGIRYLDAGSRTTAQGELLGVFKDANGYKAKVRVTNRGGNGFSAPTDSITTSMAFPTESAARQWAQSKIEGGTSNFVLFDDALPKILSRE